MSAGEAADGTRVPRIPRARRIVATVALLMLVLLGVLWIERRPIATHYIDRALRTKRVPARYRIADLGFGRQRLTDVVIGDPAHPDLVADWVETETRLDLSGPELTGVRAGHVRLRGRLVGGHVSLGAIDRLLPPPSGKPFALPALDLDVADARMRLEMPQGLVGLKLSGSGRLDDGFVGSLAMVSEQLATGGCTLDDARAAMRIRIADAAPHLEGPLWIARAACGGTVAERLGADVDATLSPALDRWQGNARIASGAVQTSVARAGAVGGTLTFTGSSATTAGRVDLAVRQVATDAGNAARVALDGRYRIGGESGYAGKVALGGASLSRRVLERLDALDAPAGTPVAPLAKRLRGALLTAGRGFAGNADIALALSNGGVAARVSAASLTAASGASAALSGGSGIALGFPHGGVRIDTQARITGGGLPDARIVLAKSAAGAPIRGTAIVAPYAAGDARLAVTPVSFTAGPRGLTHIATTATLSGPLGGGGVDSLSLPIDARWDGRGTLTLDRACVPIAWRAVRVSGLALDPARLSLCPTDGALFRLANGRVGGGARIAAARLSGRLGTTPLTLAARGADVSIGRRGFRIQDVETRIGAPDRVTRLDFASVAGTLRGSNVVGTFAGGAGQIANVPLLLADAAGDWTLAGGALRLTGTLGVSDAAAEPRFQPMRAEAVALSLLDGRIAASGTLYEPTTHTKVADVVIRHALAPGTGEVVLDVPALAFTEGFQPELLTRATFGVVADVRGTVAGAGHIAWGPDGVTSTGTFRTEGTDLAAAFGPVTGIAGEIRFTDLLALQSAPGQVATVRTINPGIPVSDGRIVYQTLPDNRVRIESGRWPFAGGTLTLEPTLLDFAAERTRRMTFDVAGMKADQFLQQFDFDNLDATGTFDGTLPMVFDADGGKIVDGQLTVRPGGGTIAYVGDLSQKDLGFWSNLAFQALKSLRYRSLAIGMNGPLAGEMVTEVRFAGVSQGEGAKSNFLVRRLQRLPFVFNIRIKAPFRGLLDSAQSFYDPKRLIQRNLPQLIEQQNKAQPNAAAPVQPADSGTVSQPKQD